jgi:hypothetical protein
MPQVDPSTSNCGLAMGRPNGLFASLRDFQGPWMSPYEEGSRVKAVREEGSVLEIDSPAFIWIVQEARGKIAQECGERLVAGDSV